jgi:hypothetical protein
VAHAGAAPAVPPGAVAEPEGEADADAAPVGLDAVGDAAAEDAAEAEDAGAELLLEGDELQPAASVTVRNATPVSSPRWVRANSVIP